MTTDIQSEVVWCNDFGFYKTLTITGTTAGEQTNYQVKVLVHRATGTDSGQDVYVGIKVRADFADLRFQNSTGTAYLNFWIESISAGVATCWVEVPTIPTSSGTVDIRMVYGIPHATTVLKMAVVTDESYDPAGASPGPADALTYIANFKSHMANYIPGAVIDMGDNIYNGVDNSTSITRITSVKNAFSGVTGTLIQEMAPGNHDFEWMTWAEYKAIFSSSWWQSGVSYGSIDVDLDGDSVNDVHLISLDPNYDDVPAHWSDWGHSYPPGPDNLAGGKIPASQLTWLENDLAATLLPTIVFCHQALGEFYQDMRPAYAFAQYHVANRAATRTILEASGKVILVLQGHQHWNRTQVIKGIPYVQLNSLGDIDAGDRQNASSRGVWNTIEIYPWEQKIIISEWEDVTQSGAPEESLRHIMYYRFGTEKRSNPYYAFAQGWANTNGEAGINTGELAQIYLNSLLAREHSDPSYYGGTGVYKTTQGIKFTGQNDAGGQGCGSWSLPNQTGNFIFSADVYFDVLDAGVSADLTWQDGTNNGPYIYFETDGHIYSYKSGEASDLGTYNVDTWYRVEIKNVNFTAHTYDIWINGSSVQTGKGFYSTSCNNINRFDVRTKYATIYVDNIKIGEYANPEPTLTSWGEEVTF